MRGLDSHLSPPEESEICDVCGNHVDTCVCPECPSCGDYGNPTCYQEGHKHFHNLTRSQLQIDTLKANESLWEKENQMAIEAEQAMCPPMESIFDGLTDQQEEILDLQHKE